MTASDLVLAAALIGMPVGADHGVPAGRVPAVMAAVREAAVGREILDDREQRYYYAGCPFLTDPDYFESDLDAVRGRDAEYRGYPRLEDAAWLPPPETIDHMCALNRAHRHWLDGRVLWEPDRAVYRAAAEETERLGRVWSAASTARRDGCYVTTRREALALVRELIGPTAWAARDLPPPVPVERFRRG